MHKKIYQTIIYIALSFIALSQSVNAGAPIQPFVLAATTTGDVSTHVAESKSALTTSGFNVVGEYSPYKGVHIIVVTNDDLINAAGSHKRAAYIAAQRVSITSMKGQVQITYTNPEYMAAAYQVKTDLSSVSAKLKAALGMLKTYGSKEGLTTEELNEYHYTFAMEYFDEPYELAVFKNYNEAVSTVENKLKNNKVGASLVYRIDIPGKNQSLFGVGLAKPENGNPYMDDKYIMTEIDFKDVRSSAHLPYEVLVNGANVEALHARFRIAINFPDLKMMGDNSFLNIMPTPDALEEALTKATGGEWEDF